MILRRARIETLRLGESKHNILRNKEMSDEKMSHE